MRRTLRALAIAGAAFGLFGAAAPSNAAPNYCLSDFNNACLVRPNIIPTGAHTYMRAVHWRSWNGANAIGFGRLIESGGCCNPSFNQRAKVRLWLPGECGSRIWYSRISINFGPHLEKRYLHDEERWPCS